MKKTVVLYQMTYVFCKRFLAAHGDRTVDQMVQAARSGKQNIVVGRRVPRLRLPTFMGKKEEEFVEMGGIRERMTAARLGRRQTQNEEIAELKAKLTRLNGLLAEKGIEP